MTFPGGVSRPPKAQIAVTPTSEVPTPDRLPPGWLDVAATPSLAEYAREVWRRRALAIEIARKRFKSRHVDSVLGELWFLLNPILLITVYWLVFGLIFNESRSIPNFAGFLSLGIFVFDYSRTALMQAAGIIKAKRGLIRSLSFPRALIPIAQLMENAYAYIPQMVVAVAMLLLTGEPITSAWLMMPVVLAVQTVWTLGACLFVARLGHHAHDVKQALPFLLRLALYLSGVIFSIEAVITSDRAVEVLAGFGIDPTTLLNAMLLNPFYDYVALARYYLLSSYTPPVDIGLLWFASCVWAVVALIGGVWFFRGAEKEYGRA